MPAKMLTAMRDMKQSAIDDRKNDMIPNTVKLFNEKISSTTVWIGKYIFLLIALAFLAFVLLFSYQHLKKSERKEWMETCTMAKISALNITGDDAFNQCMDWRKWLDHHDETDWR